MKYKDNWKKSLALLCMLLLIGVSRALASEGLADGNYAVEVKLSGGSGKVWVETPAVMTVENGKYFAQIIWSSSDYDTMNMAGITYHNQSRDEGNSSFRIPIPAFDEKVPIVANTHILGEPHEIAYSLWFYADSIGPANQLPQDAAKRVLMMAGLIILVGGVLNHFFKKRRRQDYLGKKR